MRLTASRHDTTPMILPNRRNPNTQKQNQTLKTIPIPHTFTTANPLPQIQNNTEEHGRTARRTAKQRMSPTKRRAKTPYMNRPQMIRGLAHMARLLTHQTKSFPLDSHGPQKPIARHECLKQKDQLAGSGTGTAEK